MQPSLSAFKSHYVETSLGQLHYVELGKGKPILLLHQTPRSVDEFRELIPLLAGNNRVIAMDMYGFGRSAKFPSPHSIEKYAEGVVALIAALRLSQINLLGHHTGSLVALEVAATQQDLVENLIISSLPFTDEKYRQTHKDGEGVDDAEIHDDGSHLVEFWAKRAPLYPQSRPDLLNRFIHDALNFGLDPVEGHLACARYIIENKISKIVCPTLVIGSGKDPYSYPQVDTICLHLTNSVRVEKIIIQKGMVPLMEMYPEEVAAAVTQFLKGVT
jgi:pimeloyl-ACP methyl ester carboxylesterase